MRHCNVFLAAGLLAAVLGSPAPARSAQDNPKPPQAASLSGLHDFDFLVGSWQVHHRRLAERLAGSHEWVEFDGTLEMRQLMNGFANVGDNVFDVPGGEYRGVGFRAYDPQTGLWSSWWLDGRHPIDDLDPPVHGRFENGVGVFEADDTLRGKPVRVRVTWSHITPTSAHWEQAFSADGGKTWETNWVSEFSRADQPKRAIAKNPKAPHDFDLRIGEWQAHNRRLKERLAGSREWEEFEGTQSLWQLMNGFANVDDNLLRLPSGDYRGATLRAYDPKTGQWAIWWLDGRNPSGDLNPPVRGRFEDGVGTLFADDTLRGKPIRMRFLWSHITPTSAHWEQAFSADGGKTWETNWTTDFRRVAQAPTTRTSRH